MRSLNFIKTFFNHLSAFLLLTSFLSGTLPVSAQTRRAAQTKTDKAVSRQKEKCAGGWSGVVSFKKTLKTSLESDEPGIRKSIDRIKHKTSRNYEYAGRAVVDGSDPKNAVVNTNVAFTDNDLNWGLEKVFDTCNSRESGHWFVIENTDDRQTQAQAAGSAESFNLSVDEMSGNYNFSLKFPAAKGVYKREEHTKKSGHCQPKNNEPFDRSTDQPTSIGGESFSITGQKIDPDTPDTISGSKIWGDDGKGAVRTFIYEATWRFTRCPQKLLITELKFEHPDFPNFEEWKEIEEIRGTIDGNKIKVKAKVLNMSAEAKYADLKILETYKGDKYNGARADEPLPEAESSFRLDAGEEKEFEFIWDSEGESWFDDGRPHLLHRIRAELSENGVKKDEKEKPLNIAPKPLILVHGIWSDHKIWEPVYQNLLSASHSYQWKAYAVGDRAEHGKLNMGGAMWSGQPAASVYENADRLAKYIKYAQEDSNAWHVEMVAHSTGGLVARLYLHKLMPVVADARPQVKHLMMLGTPNGGVPCVDVFVGKLDIFKEQLQAVRELTNDEMQRFNKYVVNTGGTRLSALAGNSVPVVCGGLEWNDGFVTVKSATYNVADSAQSNDLNLQLVDSKNFGNFVKPHLVTGPKGTYPYPVKNDPTNWERWRVNSRDYDVVFGPDSSFNSEPVEPGLPLGNLYVAADFAESGAGQVENYSLTGNQTFSREIKLAPRQITEIEIPVEAAPNLGVTFAANPGVAVSLINDKGVIVSRNLVDSPLSKALFRTLFTQRAVSKSVWKLKIENTTDLEQFFAGFSWSMESGLSNGKVVAE